MPHPTAEWVISQRYRHQKGLIVGLFYRDYTIASSIVMVQEHAGVSEEHRHIQPCQYTRLNRSN